MGKKREGRGRKIKGKKKGKQRVQKGREVEEEGDVIYMSMKKNGGGEHGKINYGYLPTKGEKKI